MKKYSILISIIALAIAGVSLFFSFQSKKIAYVDINQLIEKYDHTAVIRADFKKKAAVLNANVDTLMLSWKNELKVYEKEHLKMSKKELSLKQELLQNKQQQITSYQKNVEDQLKKEDQKNTNTVVSEINSYIGEYGKKNNYKLIFGTSGSGNIMYADQAQNITEIILEGLNAEYN